MNKLLLFTLSILLILSCKASVSNDKNVHNGISSSKILKLIKQNKPIVIRDKIIVDTLNFTLEGQQALVSSKQVEKLIDVPITFINCIFLEPVIAIKSTSKGTTTCRFSRNLTFESCDFRSSVIFDYTEVYGIVNFAGSVFHSNVSFDMARFNGSNCYFSNIKVVGTWSSNCVQFSSNTDFLTSTFESRVSFQESNFMGNTQFSNVHFNQTCDFSLSTFHGLAQFNYTKFNDKLLLNTAIFNKQFSLTSSHIEKDIHINSCIFRGRVLFTNTEIKGSLNIKNSYFTSGTPNFEGCKYNPQSSIFETNSPDINK